MAKTAKTTAVETTAVETTAVEAVAVEAVAVEATPNNVSPLDNARHEAVNSITRSYGALRDYAIVLNNTFAIDWFAIEHSDQSDEAKPVLAEKKKFYAELKQGLHTNPSVVWGRVCAFGKVERHGEPEKVENEGGEGGEGDEGIEADTSPNRSPMLRNVEELTTLWKFNSKQENLDPKIVEAQNCISLALACLGVDIKLL
jgi:hypothetical protein